MPATADVKRDNYAPNRQVVPVDAVVQRARILLVDDDKRNLLALSEVLDDLADVVCAVSGEEALRFLLKEQFAVIILDVLMPGLDGYDTAKLLRGREQSRDTPVIFLTAINKEEQHLLRGYDIGAVDYVFKPFDPVILRSKVTVFVSLYEKTREIERKAVVEQRLLQEKLAAQQESMQALEALKESEVRQSLILRSLPLAVYVRDEDNLTASPRFVAGNSAAITGFNPEAFIDDPDLWESRFHPDDHLPGESESDTDGRTREFRWRHSDGSYRHLLDQSVALPDRDGIFAGTLRDVTDQRHMQDQLLQAQKMDAVGKLTGGIAHDFNNLLASVLSGLSLIERRTPLNERATEILGMTRHAAEQGKHLVSRMLAFSRRQSLMPRSADLREMGRSLDGLLTPVLGGLVHLKWEIEEPLWPVLVDPPQLELAVMNLVINARDAMPTGGTITIGFRNSHANAPVDLKVGDYVVVTVSDTGRGIPPDLIPQVVEPFFTTKDVGKGTGLGLSTTYGFAKQSGGTLRIDSTVGVGTTVEIWLPRSLEDASTGAATWARSAVPREAEQNGASILLVDDNESLRGLTALQLADEGYDVASASGGAEALALIERDSRRFDIIVTDFAMPLISGLDVIRFARNVRANWPAVVITGHADVAAIAERPSDVPLVTKPYTTEELVTAIASALGRAAA
jgi:signal transduction histidine kinase